MNENCSKSIQIQMPQEKRCSKSKIDKNTTNCLEEFLKKNYIIPSNNLEELSKYIVEDHNLEKIICKLPQIISKEFPNCPILLDFMNYTLPNEKTLQITIKTPYDGETSSTKKDIILDEIFKYKSPEKYYFITMDF